MSYWWNPTEFWNGFISCLYTMPLDETCQKWSTIPNIASSFPNILNPNKQKKRSTILLSRPLLKGIWNVPLSLPISWKRFHYSYLKGDGHDKPIHRLNGKKCNLTLTWAHLLFLILHVHILKVNVMILAKNGFEIRSEHGWRQVFHTGPFVRCFTISHRYSESGHYILHLPCPICAHPSLLLY